MKIQWIGYHRFNKENIKKYVPENAGVYKISVKLKNGDLRPIYVGQAKFLFSRLSQYAVADTDNKCLIRNLKDYQCHFKVAEVAKQADRDAVEKALYNRYKPECNDGSKIPDVTPADVNCD